MALLACAAWEWGCAVSIPKTIETRWALRTYDVWGNAKEGWDVNDVRGHGTVDLTLDVQEANPGTTMAFYHATPTDRQLRKVFGLGKQQIDTDGDDTIIYVNRRRDGYPVGELRCESHVSLSPIRPVGGQVMGSEVGA